MAVHLAVAGDVFDGVCVCYSFFPRGVLGEICVLESVSEDISTYSHKLAMSLCHSNNP